MVCLYSLFSTQSSSASLANDSKYSFFGLPVVRFTLSIIFIFSVKLEMYQLTIRILMYLWEFIITATIRFVSSERPQNVLISSIYPDV